MARPLRLEFSGALYHVTSRGNRRHRIFDDDHDRLRFQEILGQTVHRFSWICHAYCLMGNHYHLMIETPVPNLSRGMRHLNGVYTQAYNVRHRRVGHLFQGRYKAILVEKDAHLLELCRYIVLNPVRARMVSAIRQWKWSSYLATAGYRKPLDFLFTDWVLRQFGSSRRRGQEGYRRFVRAGIGESSRLDDVVGGVILGTEKFVERCRRKLSGTVSLAEVPRRRHLSARPTLKALLGHFASKQVRNRAITRAYMKHGYTMKEIAEFLGIHYATVSRAIKQSEVRMS